MPSGAPSRRPIEHVIERTMFASRWLLAPVYMGLALGLVALGLKFFQEAFHLVTHTVGMNEADLPAPCS
jgi:uncharacterized protein (TIGR00645 family)